MQSIVRGATKEELLEVASFYDYLEIQPICNNGFLVDNGTVSDVKVLQDYNRTILELGRELGKPHTQQDAFDMLSLLSGRTHEVVTVLSVCRGERTESEAVVTRVTFRALTDEEIRAYIATGEPMDKAGSYGIQGYGAMFVKCIEGDYFSVMGLPLCPLCRMLRAFGVSILDVQEAQA